jgi:hypothetical protein
MIKITLVPSMTITISFQIVLKTKIKRTSSKNDHKINVQKNVKLRILHKIWINLLFNKLFI